MQGKSKFKLRSLLTVQVQTCVIKKVCCMYVLRTHIFGICLSNILQADLGQIGRFSAQT